MSQPLHIPAFQLARSDHGLPPLDTGVVSLEPGSVLAVTGPSGAGKSLWLKSLFGWAAPGQAALLAPARGAFLMTQDPSRGLTPGYSIAGHFRDVIGARRELAQPVLDALDLSLDMVWDRKPDQLSGGQKQRLMLALILVSQPRILVCDEPAASLDAENETRLWELVLRPELRCETLIFVTHRLNLIEAHADRVLLLDEGRIRFDGDTRQFFDEPVDALQQQLVSLYRQSPAPTAEPNPSREPVLLKARDLSLTYAQTPVLSGLSLELRRGDWLWLSGPSGAGKTSLAKLIAGLAPQASGDIRFDGQSLALDAAKRPVPLRRAIQYVFQHGGLALNPALTVAGQLNRLWSEDTEGLSDILTALRLNDLDLKRRPRYFSQGELQRLNLIAVLSVKPRLLILDEILEPLDLSLTHLVLDFLEVCCGEGLTVIMISHDPALPVNRRGDHMVLSRHA